MAAPSTIARSFTAVLLMAAVACSEPTTPTAEPPASVSLAIVASTRVTVKSFQLSTNTLRIDGPAVTADLAIENSGLAISGGVSIHALVTQGRASREAANLPLLCSRSRADIGKLPTGICGATFAATASNATVGAGTLAPGSATMIVRVIQTVRGTATVLASKSVAINLIAQPINTPKITSVVLQSNVLVIGGASVGYTAMLQNAGPPQTDVLLQGVLEQDQGGVTVVKGAGGALVTCGAGVGVLPTTGTGTCSMGFSVAASSSTIGGSLVPGPARFVLHLYKAIPNVDPIEYDKRIIDVTLVPQTPSIVSVTPTSSFVVLDKVGAATPVSVSLSNPGPAISTVIVQGEIRQGIAIRGAGGSIVACGASLGTLPNGSCVETSLQITASNAAGGAGTLVPGNATYVLTLLHFDGVNTTTLDSKTIPITLVADAPRIVSP